MGGADDNAPAEPKAAGVEGETEEPVKGFDVSVFENVDYGDEDEDDEEGGEGMAKRRKFFVSVEGVDVDAGIFSNLDEFDSVDVDETARACAAPGASASEA